MSAVQIAYRFRIVHLLVLPNTSVRFTDVPGLSPASHISYFENAQIPKPQINPQLFPFISCHILYTPVICGPVRKILKKKNRLLVLFNYVGSAATGQIFVKFYI